MQQVPQPDLQLPAVQIQEPPQEEVAAYIADTLGETEEGARKSILHIIRAVGRTHARELLNMTLQTEEHGGLMLPDGSRRRTPGGVFFYLAYSIGKTQNGKPLQRQGNPVKKPKKEQPASLQAEPKKQFQSPLSKPVPQSTPIFPWDDRLPAVKEAEIEKGQANVKITIIGRPGKIVDKGTCIVTVMESTKIPALPKGLPTPTNLATKYAVYITSKQWKKVEEAIKDPEDTLIIEGFPKTDPEVSAIAVFATNVTTKKLQMAKKQPAPASQS
jgi:hypothetical protein